MYLSRMRYPPAAKRSACPDDFPFVCCKEEMQCPFLLARERSRPFEHTIDDLSSSRGSVRKFLDLHIVLAPIRLYKAAAWVVFPDRSIPSMVIIGIFEDFVKTRARRDFIVFEDAFAVWRKNYYKRTCRARLFPDQKSAQNGNYKHRPARTDL